MLSALRRRGCYDALFSRVQGNELDRLVNCLATNLVTTRARVELLEQLAANRRLRRCLARAALASF
ncbi:MAG: hypothetical protein HC927_11960, partial [Deltaproteobacteria bacterium]|nr:hypothetical protein [Deltaproteobacteria bacterium]